ncbi:NtaA/DmoA family FMN-dependent monooxygenase [Pseudoclavibacter endophyticus]|nr:NtaA/DmoA family FMN-dependent monooxygenase [Pseudoclavibacter endophyticus]
MATPPTGQYAASWMHPEARSDWLDATYWIDTARALEVGGFDLMFLPDALAVPEDREGSFETTLETGGKGAVYLDPVVTLATVAGATSTIGLGATVSTSFAPPYLIARSLLTLDHLSGGRCAWNIVTSTTDAEARNMGGERIAPKAERYDRADRVVDEVVELMRSWEPGALLLDADGGRFADPCRVHRAARGGETTDGRGHRRAMGPLTVPRSRQDHPVLMQAGASDRGLEFAARWAEIAFIWAEDRETAAAARADLRHRAAAIGRDPDGLRVCVGVQPIAAASDEAARMLVRDLEDRLDPELTMRALARIFHADATVIDPAEPATEFLDRHRGATGAEGFERMLRRRCERERLTVGRFATLQSMTQLAPQFVGAGASIADELCEWVDSGACDGFVVTAAVHNASLLAFAEHVGPELRRRGRLRGARRPEPDHPHRETLRERLGMVPSETPGAISRVV